MRNTILFLFLILNISPFYTSAQYEVMVSTDYPPYNYVNEKGELVGFNIDILKAIKKLYNVEIKVTPGDWILANAELGNGNIQAIAGAHYPGNPDTKYEYTRSVIQTSHCFLYNHKNTNRISLEGVRTAQQPLIVLWKNDVLTHYVLSINPNAKFIFVDNYEDLLNNLDRKDVTCAFSQKIASLFFAHKLGKTYIHTGQEEILERNMGFKISKDAPQLAEILNNGLEVIMANGEYQKIYDTWIKPYNTNQNTWQYFFKYLIFAGILVAITIILLLFINQILQKRVRAKTKDLQMQLVLNTEITKELEKQKIKAEESDKMKSAFLANMSHEIRTPMNGILGFTELLKSHDYSQDEQKHFIDIIQQSGDRMLSTINNIVEISKIESGVETIQISQTNIENIILELYQFFIPETKRKGIELLLEKNAASTNPPFFSDQYKLNSILTNLIKNAIKFTSKGSVKIGYLISEKMASFYISDTGIGIEKEKQKAIFDHFVQANSSHSSGYEGSGLGLSISNEYVKMLNGKIWVESETGKGTTFFVNIPNQFKKIELKEKPAQSIKEEKPEFPKNLKILVAEDDNVSYFFLKYILEEMTSNILRASDGVQAVELIKNNPDTDIILMDSKMPKLNGLEAVKEIRKFNNKVYIIAQTAYAQNGYKTQTIEAGCNAYIEKPINKSKLLNILTHSGLVK